MRRKPLQTLEGVSQLRFDWHIDFPIVEEDIKVKVKEAQENTEQVAYLEQDLPDVGEILRVRYKD